MTAQCTGGTYAFGNLQRRCLPTGQWTSSSGVCNRTQLWGGKSLGMSTHAVLVQLGWPRSLRADACEGEEYGGILWPLTQINTTSYGSCKPGYIALNAISPQRRCRSDQTWDSTVTGNCTGVSTTPRGGGRAAARRA